MRGTHTALLCGELGLVLPPKHVAVGAADGTWAAKCLTLEMAFYSDISLPWKESGAAVSATVIPKVALVGGTRQAVGSRPLDAALTLCPCALLAGTISTNIEKKESKTYFTCTLNSSAVDILGHRWMRGGKVLQEDTLPDLQMQYS